MAQGLEDLLAPLLVRLFSAPFSQVADYKDNIQRMRNEFERLECMKLDMQLMVDEAVGNNQVVGHLARHWMDRVSEAEARATKISEESNQVGNGCFNIWCLNLKSSHRLSKRAHKTTRDIVELLNVQTQINRVAYPPPPTVAENLVFEDNGNDGLIVDAPYAPLRLCRRFTFAEIQSATQNFNEAFFIGKGGFGRVYKGFVENGATAVAIKRLDSESSQGVDEFRKEIEMLPRFRHCNLVSLIGYCHEDREMILVYELMPNGSLADHLHPKDGGKNGNSPTLSWVLRLKICIGAARGIDYLHTGTGVLERVIHRDVKTSNILLDENWAAKVSDFGLCKKYSANESFTHVSTRVKGTLGYCDPEYCLTRRLTKESDVYAFGVVLFEVLSGKPAIDFSLPMEKRSLATWAQQSIQENTTHRLTDPNLKWEIFPNSLEAFVGIAGQCLQNDSKKRPKMFEVVTALESALRLQRSTDSSLLNDDIFPSAGTYDDQERVQSEVISAVKVVQADDALNVSERIPNVEQGPQNKGDSVGNDYKESNELEANEGSRELEIERKGDDDDDGTSSTKNNIDNRRCKNCRKVESCVLLLPCKHLCLCTTCESVLHACPVCNSTKDATILINMSSQTREQNATRSDASKVFSIILE